MATPAIRFPASMILLAGLLTGFSATADTPASTEATTRQRSVDPEILLATPAAPVDIRGFQAGDSVTLVRESADYKRVVTYVYAGDERWQLVSNLLKTKTAL